MTMLHAGGFIFTEQSSLRGDLALRCRSARQAADQRVLDLEVFIEAVAGAFPP